MLGSIHPAVMNVIGLEMLEPSFKPVNYFPARDPIVGLLLVSLAVPFAGRQFPLLNPRPES